MSPRRTVTLNISDSSIRVLSTRGDQLLRWGSLPLSPGTVTDGAVPNAAELAPQVAKLFQTHQVSREGVSIALSDLGTTARIVALPRLEKKKMRQEALLREAKRVMPLPLEEMSLAYQPIERRDGEERFFMLGVARRALQAQVSALKQMGIVPHLMEPKSVALARAVNRRQALVLDLEPEGLEIVLVSDGLPLLTRRAAWGREASTPEQRLQLLIVESSRLVKFCTTAYPDCPLLPNSPAFLTGELAGDPALMEVCRRGLPYPIEMIAPPLKCPAELPLAQFAVNLGLAMKGLAPPRGQPPFPLAQLRVPYEVAQPRRSYLPYMAIIAAAALLLPLYQTYSGTVSQTAQLQAQVGDTNRQLKLNRKESLKVKELTRALESAQKAAKSLEGANQGILDLKADFHQTLREIERLMGPEMSLTALQGSRSQLSLKGKGRDFASIMQYREALRATGLFAEVNIISLSKELGKGGEVVFVIVAEKQPSGLPGPGAPEAKKEVKK